MLQRLLQPYTFRLRERRANLVRTLFHHEAPRALARWTSEHETEWAGNPYKVLEPLEFMERLAALVPRPRLHLIRFHGVLAPNAKLRSKIVPAPPERATEPPTDHASAQGDTPRMSWARLLKRVFDIDIEHCPNCGGALNRKFQLSLRQLTRSLVKRYISG